MADLTYKSHWEKVYHKTAFNQLGWYEKQAILADSDFLRQFALLVFNPY